MKHEQRSSYSKDENGEYSVNQSTVIDDQLISFFRYMLMLITTIVAILVMVSIGLTFNKAIQCKCHETAISDTSNSRS